MFDHLKFRISNSAKSKAFFIKALEPLSTTEHTEWPPNGMEMYKPGDQPLGLHSVASIGDDWGCVDGSPNELESVELNCVLAAPH